MATPPVEFNEFINMCTKNTATASSSMAPSVIAAGITMHHGMAKDPFIFFKGKGHSQRIRGTTNFIANMEMGPLSIVPTIVIDSLSFLDRQDILYRNCYEDDCSWKQGQVAKWCNKYPKKGRKR